MSRTSMYGNQAEYYARTYVPSEAGSGALAYSQSATGGSRHSASSHVSSSTIIPNVIADWMIPVGDRRVVGGIEFESLSFGQLPEDKDYNNPNRARPEKRRYLGHSKDDQYSMVGVEEDVGDKRQLHFYARPATTGPSQRRLLPIVEGQDSGVGGNWAREVSTRGVPRYPQTHNAASDSDDTVEPDDSISQMVPQGYGHRGDCRKAFIATLLFDPSMSALPIIPKQNSVSVGLFTH